MPSSAPSHPPLPSKTGLLWSLLINAVLLLAAGLFLLSWLQSRTSEEALRLRLDKEEAAAKGLLKPSAEPAKVGPYQAYGTQGWRVWIDQLRKSGLPEGVIARLAIAESQEAWDQQDLKAQTKLSRGELSLKQYDELMKASDTIQEKALRAALGDDGFLRWDKDRTLRSLGLSKMELTEPERTELYTLQKGLADERTELELQQQEGLLDPADYSALQEKAYYDTQAQIKKLLGDDRYAISQNGGDPAIELRRLLGDYKPTEQQFKQMIEAQKQWTLRHEEVDRYQSPPDEAEDVKSKMNQALENERKEAYKKALGADGYATFQKQQDSRYITMKQYAPGWGLTPESVETLYSAVASFEKTMQDARAEATAKEAKGEQVDWEKVSAAEEEVRAKADQYFQKTLGAEKTLRLTKASVLVLNSQPDQ